MSEPTVGEILAELRRYTRESVMPSDWHDGMDSAIKAIERLRKLAKRRAASASESPRHE